MDERHYNSKKLTIIFAVSSVLLLGSVVWMAVADYARPWKEYQKEFRALEIEKTRIKFDQEENLLNADEQYKNLTNELAAASEKFKESCPDYDNIEQTVAQLQASDDLNQQQYKFAKAELDAAKYRYEEAKAHHKGNLNAAEGEYNTLNMKVNQLKKESDASAQKLLAQKARLNDCQKQVKELDRQSRKISSRRDLLMRKLTKIDPNAMSFTNRIAQLVRDQPIIDLANPSFKVEQIVLKDIHDDVNFMTVPKVDRCITCHLGIDNPDYQNAVQPFKTHPNLELYIGKDSPHPMEEFGCTVCHGGRGRSTDFYGAVHTPQSPQQRKEWEEKYNWKKFTLWEEPMLPLKYVEAGCFKCHSGQTTIQGADKLNLGLQLIETAGCYACHLIDKYADWPKPGPSLEKLGSKLTKEWAYQWVKNPHSFRADTWMPAFFNQSNNNDPEAIKRTDQEIIAIVHYLFENATSYDTRSISAKGDAMRGEELVKSVGCMACHNIEASQQGHETITSDQLRQEFGPNLTGLGSKVTKEWIFNWLKDPTSYHQQTRMPNLRLSDQEAADIAEFLHQSQAPDFQTQSVTKVDINILDTIMLDFLTKDKALAQAKEEISLMTQDQKLSFAGKKLIGHYGCYSCHDIKGFENIKPVGTELTEEGSKDVHKLDFGFIHIDHTKWAWFDQKLKEPRIFDKGKIKAHYEKLRMPNYYFSQKETDAIVTAILGFVETHTVKGKKPNKDVHAEYIEEGQQVVRQFNCQACHIIENEGGSIQKSVKEWLMESDGRSESEAEAVVTSFSPPNLIGEGKKVQAKWLFEFLHKPTTIRPWLKVRMPTYEFNGAHLNALVKYFNALDKSSFPFPEEIDTTMSDDEFKVAEKLFSTEYFGCAQCHIVGDQLPAGSPDSWAPDFALAKTRLRPGWIIDWLKDPQSLLPGTKMPTYFDPENFDISGPDDILDGDENEQIRYLRNYLMTLADVPVKKKSPPPSVPTPPQPTPAQPTQ